MTIWTDGNEFFLTVFFLFGATAALQMLSAKVLKVKPIWPFLVFFGVAVIVCCLINYGIGPFGKNISGVYSRTLVTSSLPDVKVTLSIHHDGTIFEDSSLLNVNGHYTIESNDFVVVTWTGGADFDNTKYDKEYFRIYDNDLMQVVWTNENWYDLGRWYKTQ